MNQPSLEDLKRFIDMPTVKNTSSLVEIPSLLRVLQLYSVKNTPYPAPLLSLCRWLHTRGMEVMEQLTKQSNVDAIVQEQPFDQSDVPDWKEVSPTKI